MKKIVLVCLFVLGCAKFASGATIGTEPDQSYAIGNAIAIEADCSYVPEAEVDNAFRCPRYWDLSLMKAYASIGLSKFSGLEKLTSWIEQEEYDVLIFKYRGRQYILVYVHEVRVFGVKRVESI